MPVSSTPAPGSPAPGSPTSGRPVSGSSVPGSTVTGSLLARRQLGRRLRALRKRAGKTMADVAITGISSEAKLYRIETGQTSMRTGDVRELCLLYGAPDDLLDGLLALARASKQGAWQEDYEDILRPGFGLYVDLEAAATTLQTYNSELVHGLLQTPDYARAVNAADPDAGQAQQARWLEVQQARQRTALDRNSPLRITQILGQAALTRVIGSPEVLAAQLDHLRALNRREHLDVRILPWDSGAHLALMGGAFTVLSFAQAADPDVVYLESQAAARYLEQEGHLRRYRRIWAILAGQSVPLEEHVR
jgi:transcriptional regulator with XRE-family HTH domain